VLLHPPQEVTTLNKVTRATADLDYWVPVKDQNPVTTPPETMIDIVILALSHGTVRISTVNVECHGMIHDSDL
jgi:hypothetical protein